jgi:hypothetical protein
MIRHVAKFHDHNSVRKISQAWESPVRMNASASTFNAMPDATYGAQRMADGDAALASPLFSAVDLHQNVIRPPMDCDNLAGKIGTVIFARRMMSGPVRTSRKQETEPSHCAGTV